MKQFGMDSLAKLVYSRCKQGRLLFLFLENQFIELTTSTQQTGVEYQDENSLRLASTCALLPRRMTLISI